MSEPTTDDLARWANTVDCPKDTPGDRCPSCAAARRTAVPRLLALVAAQAGQIAELRGEVDLHDAHTEWTYQVGGFIGAGIYRSRDAAEAMMDDLRQRGWTFGALVSRRVTPWRLDGEATP